MESEYLNEFPADANVRLGVRGLAFCKLNTKETTIHFLRHVKSHNLRLSIYRRRNHTDKPQVFSGIRNQPIGQNENIKVSTTATSPQTIFADIAKTDEKLFKLINLPYYHKGSLKEKPLPSDLIPPTTLSTDNFRFYTLELVIKDHCLWDGNVIVIDNEKIGYSLGGKVKVNDGSVTTIQIGKEKPISLPQNEGGEWLYDILVENDCNPDVAPCEAPDPEDLDFKHYYDVLEDENSPTKKLRLSVSQIELEVSLKFREVRTGACNVAILEPEIQPE